MPGDASALLREIAVRLRAAGEGAWLRMMAAEMRTEAQPLVASVKNAARAKLPKSGGLNEYVADKRITVSVRSSARLAEVRLESRQHAAATTDIGKVRHKVFGVWRPDVPTQLIPQAAGWWSETLAKESPAVTPALYAVMERVAAEIQGRGI